MLRSNVPDPREGDVMACNPSLGPRANTEMGHPAEATRAPRNERAADVVVEGNSNSKSTNSCCASGGNGAACPDGDAVVAALPDAPDALDVRNRKRRRRTMGEVYPIMRHTIYSDDECEEEVVLSARDCGALFIRYINGIFQYFVRNPKSMGLIFTTAIILLFFKYSQQQVVKVVNAAVKAHPGLEPTDTLRSAVVTFTRELSSLERVAQTVGWSYERDRAVGYNISTAAGAAFFALVNNLQSTFTSNLRTYVAYALPSGTSSAAADVLTAHWGQIGCSTEGKKPMCYYVTTDSVASEWLVPPRDSDTVPDGKGSISATGVYIEELVPELLPVVSVARKGSPQASTGVWTRPSMTQGPFSATRVRTISYLFPIAYNAEGYATALAGVDVMVELLMDTVDMSSTPNIELVVVDNRYNTSEGGQFVYDSFNGSLFWSTPYGVRNTPVRRINALVEPVFGYSGTTLATNASFYQNGLIYQSLTMMDHWTLIASSPLALSVAEVVAVLGSIVKESESIAKAAVSLYRNCEAAANTKSDSTSVEAFAQIDYLFGMRLHSLYMPYTLSGANQVSSDSSSVSSSSMPSSSSSTSELSSLDATTTSTTAAANEPAMMTTTTTPTPSDSASIVQADEVLANRVFRPHARRAGTLVENADDDTAPTASSSAAAAAARKWGACGCSFSSSNDTTCFYTSSSQLETIFKGSVLSQSPADATKMRDFRMSQRSNFVSDYIDGINATAGFWTVPYVSKDAATGEAFVAVSYVYPSSHSPTGIVTRAAVLDTTATWMMQALKMYQHAGTSGLYLIDRRNTGIFVASSTHTSAVKNVYPALSTPYSDFNRIAEAVYTMAGNSWETSFSFHMRGSLVNYQVVLGQWGVIEVMPGETALERYLPTPAVASATDAIRLLSLSQTVELFLYVGGILLLYFLNLLILGCSKLGK
ncbi:hypothetical protein ABL78_6042 [Leptomonas seymouri]|uniref:Uncharacterized protein n=1 Tax=Leptomonas seymouri TaxID=5684 RepID=A0A0N0P4K1_LEPSE|nr:hypothetical protein ABL78_6042 [Leptomonas seymouri]|eukprot:KPI84917.1 hypothetical protein ABL78_6042 [Leptomonas seymouri]